MLSLASKVQAVPIDTNMLNSATGDLNRQFDNTLLALSGRENTGLNHGYGCLEKMVQGDRLSKSGILPPHS